MPDFETVLTLTRVCVPVCMRMNKTPPPVSKNKYEDLPTPAQMLVGICC